MIAASEAVIACSTRMDVTVPTRKLDHVPLPAELEGCCRRRCRPRRACPTGSRRCRRRPSTPSTPRVGDTVKRCPPFIDAMTAGFLIPLICDLKVENGEFSWDNDLPPGGAVDFARSPIGFHDASQVIGTPLFDADRFLIKFHNLWTIEAPEGYVAAVHPSGQPLRPAVHHADRPGGLRPLPRKLDPFSGPLARCEFQRRAAEGHADRPMHAGEARELDRRDRARFTEQQTQQVHESAPDRDLPRARSCLSRSSSEPDFSRKDRSALRIIRCRRNFSYRARPQEKAAM